jgi:hypothetical protein
MQALMVTDIEIADEEDAQATPTMSGGMREREATPLGKDIPILGQVKGMRYPQGLRVQVPRVKGTSPGSEYLQYPHGYGLYFFWETKHQKLNFWGIFRYF